MILMKHGIKKIVNDQHDLIQMQKERIKFLEKMVQKSR